MPKDAPPGFTPVNANKRKRTTASAGKRRARRISPEEEEDEDEDAEVEGVMPASKRARAVPGKRDTNRGRDLEEDKDTGPYPDEHFSNLDPKHPPEEYKYWWRKSKLYQKRYNEERVKTDDLEIQLARKYARLHHHEVKDLNKRWKDAMVKIKGLEDANRILRSRVEKKMWGFVKDPKPPVYESSDATEEEA